MPVDQRLLVLFVVTTAATPRAAASTSRRAASSSAWGYGWPSSGEPLADQPRTALA